LIKKTKITINIFIILFTFLFIEVIYLKYTKSMSVSQLNKKKQFLQIVQMPDLAICTTTISIRHRSLSDTFSIYKDDPSLREHFLSTFTYKQGS
jgi:hypothetical protein